MAGLKFANVVKKFGEVTVVQELNLEITEGEFVVLLGESGCGKSTTLRMIAGLEEVSEGKIYIDGRDVTNLPPMERDIAMVFQNYALYPHMNVEENLSFALRLRHEDRAKIKEKVDKAAKILNIEPLLKRKPKELSGGQRQRVAIGRAIVREPKVFLFDEPLSNLDAKLRGHMRTEIALLHERLGKTTVYVTHDQVEAMTLANRIVIFDKGIIQQVGTASEVYSKPANLFVAGFIGTPTMNFLSAKIVQENNQFILKGLNGDGFVINAPQSLAQKLSANNIKINPEGVILGIRPQSLRIATDAKACQTISHNVQFVEFLGSESHIVGKIENSDDKIFSAIIKGDARSFAHKKVHLEVSVEEIHIFDLASGRRISD